MQVRFLCQHREHELFGFATLELTQGHFEIIDAKYFHRSLYGLDFLSFWIDAEEALNALDS